MNICVFFKFRIWQGGTRIRAAMHLSDNGFARDLRRYELAHRMVEFEVRTSTIAAWTGLPERRVRRMYQAMLAGPGISISRVRGPPPSDRSLFFSSPKNRAEAAAAAVLCELCGAMPAERGAKVVERFAGVVRGERLCRAWEMFCAMVMRRSMTFEHLILLSAALASGEAMSLDYCASCDGAILVDVVRTRRRVCSDCSDRNVIVKLRRPSRQSEPDSDRDTLHGAPMFYQGSLF